MREKVTLSLMPIEARVRKSFTNFLFFQIFEKVLAVIREEQAQLISIEHVPLTVVLAHGLAVPERIVPRIGNIFPMAALHTIPQLGQFLLCYQLSFG
ncbi:MAG: hypothetical protein ABSG17_02675 [Spirochaetia bacterium]|jgi:hypothetical protein